MLKYLFTLSILALLTVNAQARPECPGSMPTKKEFLKEVSFKYDVWTLSPSGQEKLRVFIKKVSKENISDDLEIYFAPVGVNTTGIAYMTKGCLKPNSQHRLASVDIAKLFHDAGITPEEIVKHTYVEETEL